MGVLHKCLTCDRPITWRFAICSACEKTHGSSPEQWPNWLRFLWNDIQRERRRRRRVYEHEVEMDEAEMGYAIAASTSRSGKVTSYRATL